MTVQDESQRVKTWESVRNPLFPDDSSKRCIAPPFLNFQHKLHDHSQTHPNHPHGLTRCNVSTVAPDFPHSYEIAPHPIEEGDHRLPLTPRMITTPITAATAIKPQKTQPPHSMRRKPANVQLRYHGTRGVRLLYAVLSTPNRKLVTAVMPMDHLRAWFTAAGCTTMYGISGRMPE